MDYLLPLRKKIFFFRKKRGFTLVELLIAIAVSSILVGVVVFALKTSLSTYYFVQEDAFLQKILDEALHVVSDGDFDSYGIKDSLEIMNAGKTSITFVPLWVDDSHISGISEKKEFILNRPFKAGSSLPIGEVFIKGKRISSWKQLPVAFFLDKNRSSPKPKDRIKFNFPVPAGKKVRFIYHPDTERFPDCTMTIGLDAGRFIRRYENKVDFIPKHNIGNVEIRDVRFKYFDNTNTEIIPELLSGVIKKEKIHSITAIKLSVTAVIGEKQKTGSVFVNIRNTRAAGSGLIIREGTKIKIPDSKKIRVFSLVNIIGAKNGGLIKLEAKSTKGQGWRATIELGIKNDVDIIKKYSIDYPPGRTIYSERVNLTTDLPLNFLAVGGDGRYDYDFDQDIDNVVNLEGDVILTVLKMDAAGAAVFIRP